MVEILSRGQKPEEKEFKATCSNCLTVFKFKAHETTFSQDQRDPGKYIKCPLCSNTVWDSSFQPYQDYHAKKPGQTPGIYER